MNNYTCSDVQGHLQDADQGCDHAELKLEMLQMSGLGNMSQGQQKQRHHQPKQKHCYEEVYPEGGSKVWWVTDEEDIDSTQSLDDDYIIYKGLHIDHHHRASSPNSHPPHSNIHRSNT